MAAPLYIPTSNARGFKFLYILVRTCYFPAFWYSNSRNVLFFVKLVHFNVFYNMINSPFDDCGYVRLLGSIQTHSNIGFPGWFVVFNNYKEFLVWNSCQASKTSFMQPSILFRIVSNLGIFAPNNFASLCHRPNLPVFTSMI